MSSVPAPAAPWGAPSSSAGMVSDSGIRAGFGLSMIPKRSEGSESTLLSSTRVDLESLQKTADQLLLLMREMEMKDQAMFDKMEADRVRDKEELKSLVHSLYGESPHSNSHPSPSTKTLLTTCSTHCTRKEPLFPIANRPVPASPFFDKTPQLLPLLIRKLCDKIPQSSSRAPVTNVNVITSTTSSPPPVPSSCAVTSSIDASSTAVATTTPTPSLLQSCNDSIIQQEVEPTPPSKSSTAPSILLGEGEFGSDLCPLDSVWAHRRQLPGYTHDGVYEALELKEGGSDYLGIGIIKAVCNVNSVTGSALVGEDPTEQTQINTFMVQELDGNKLAMQDLKSSSAIKVFDEMLQLDVLSWNAVISTLVNGCRYKEAFELFREMKMDGKFGNLFTSIMYHNKTLNILNSSFSNAMQASVKGIWQQLCFDPGGVCAMVQATDLKNTLWPRKKELRVVKKKSGSVRLNNAVEFDKYAKNNLLMCLKCVLILDVCCMFDEMSERNAISWNTMIFVLFDLGAFEEAVDLFLIICSECSDVHGSRTLMEEIFVLFDLGAFEEVVDLFLIICSECSDVHGSRTLMEEIHATTGLSSAFIAINNSDVPNLSPEYVVKRDSLIYGSYNALRSYWLVINEIELSASFALPAVKMLMVHLLGDKEAGKSCLQEWLRDAAIANSLVLRLIGGIIYIHEQYYNESLKHSNAGGTRELLALNVQIFIKMHMSDYPEKQLMIMQQIDEDHTLTQLANVWISLAVGASKTHEAYLIFQDFAERYLMTGTVLKGRVFCCMLMGKYDSSFVSCALIDMYSKCDSLKEAQWVFDELPGKSVVAWNLIIAHYVLHGYNEDALDLSYEMQAVGVKMDQFTYSMVIRICARLGSISITPLRVPDEVQNFKASSDVGINAKMMEYEGIKPNLYVVASFLHACACSGSLNHGQHVHDFVARNGLTNSQTFSCIFKCLWALRKVKEGEVDHGNVVKLGFDPCIAIGTALIAFCAKCSLIESAVQVFDKMSEKDVISWNSIIENANYDDILAQSGAFMVAQGGLDMEIPIEMIFSARRVIIFKCNRQGKHVVIATQAIIKFPRHTQAETSVVANTVFKGTDHVMLSGETTAGTYPELIVQATTRNCWEAESYLDYGAVFKRDNG